jgi:hypothetical protein
LELPCGPGAAAVATFRAVHDRFTPSAALKAPNRCKKYTRIYPGKTRKRVFGQGGFGHLVRESVVAGDGIEARLMGEVVLKRGIPENHGVDDENREVGNVHGIDHPRVF